MEAEALKRAYYPFQGSDHAGSAATSKREPSETIRLGIFIKNLTIPHYDNKFRSTMGCWLCRR